MPGTSTNPTSAPPLGPEFTGLESHLTRWEDPVTPPDILELAKSRSYYLAAGEATRAKVLGQSRLVPARASWATPPGNCSRFPT